MEVQEYIKLKMVFLVDTKEGKKIPLDEDRYCFKQFIYKTDPDLIENITKKKNSKEELIWHLQSDRYFWEFLEDLELIEPIRILNIEFVNKEEKYSFGYLDQEFEDQYWIEAGLYGEEFGMHSDFDFYEALYGVDEENKKYYF